MSKITPPLVSVVMPVFNRENYLPEAISSILQQTYTNFEFIIVDDGSTDNSLKIIQQFCQQDPHIILLINESNLGVSASRNKGYSIAKGKYLAVMDSDDIALPERFQKQVEFLESHPEVGVLGTLAKIQDENGNIVEQYEVPADHSLIVWMLPFGRAFAHPTTMIRADVLRQVGGYPANAPYGQDLVLWTKLAAVTRFANLQEDLLTYRTHTEAISRKNLNTQTDISIQTRRKFIASVLGKPMSSEMSAMLKYSQNPEFALTQNQIQEIITVIHQLFAGMLKKGYIIDEESDLVLEKMSKMILQIANQKKEIIKPSLNKKVKLFAKRLIARSAKFVQSVVSYIKTKKKQVNHKTELIPKKENDGLTIIILTYNRVKSLNALLRSIQQQDLTKFNIELIIANNFCGNDIEKKIDKKLLHELQNIADVKMLDSSFNWKTRMRYALVGLAKHERILFLDDDVVLINPNFFRYMWDTSNNLQEFDILSCWCTIWTECQQETFSCVGLNFNIPEITNLTQCDIAGPGICMFNRKLVLNPVVFDTVTARGYEGSSDMLFSLVASMQMNSNSYYLPSYGMLDFHQEFEKNAMHQINNFYTNRHRVYRILYENGYIPVIKRVNYQDTTPEYYAVKTLNSQTQSW